jgi:hypothetical protein
MQIQAWVLLLVKVGWWVNEHLRIQRRLSLHTLFFCFESLKKICNFPPNAFNTIKFTQIGKGVGEDMKYLLERGSMFDYE